MNKEGFIKKISDVFGLSKNDDFFLKIEGYKQLLQEYNAKFNLTRLDKEDLIYGDYFYNSISPYAKINLNAKLKILDIGSGSGVPGILLALLFKNSRVTLIESNNKKCFFLQKLIDYFKINNVEIRNARIEDFARLQSNQETFDIVTCRAFAPLKIIIEVGFPLLKIGGKLIAPKSKNYSEEIKEASWICDQLKVKDLIVDIVDSESIQVFNIEIIKYEKTSDFFPRTWKEIVK